jgi:hypothetical protein
MTITGSEKQDSPSTSIPARKRTPTACKTWKEKLRLACIDRARRRRRNDHENDGNGHESGGGNGSYQPSDEIDGDSSMSIQQLPSARAILEEELRQQGITVVSPCINMDNRNEQQQQQRQLNAYSASSPSKDMSSRYSQVDSPSAAAFTANDSGINAHTSGVNTDDYNNAIHANHYISEEELFELLQEVEEEMQRSEEEMYQMLARERENELEQQVQDFEEQQQEQEAASINSSSWNNAVPLAVLCPICKEANLSETMQGGILCPNHMDGSCPFELRAGNGDAHQHGLALTLENVCQQLRWVYEQHALYCHDYLSFEVNDTMIHGEQQQQQQQQQGQAENTSLVAVCPSCETRMQLV